MQTDKGRTQTGKWNGISKTEIGNRKLEIGYYLRCDWTWAEIAEPAISIIHPVSQTPFLSTIRYLWYLINMQQPNNDWGPAELSCQASGKLFLICLCITGSHECLQVENGHPWWKTALGNHCNAFSWTHTSPYSFNPHTSPSRPYCPPPWLNGIHVRGRLCG